MCKKGNSVLADHVPFLSQHLFKATRTRLARLPGDDEISELGGVAGVLLEPSDSMGANSTIEEWNDLQRLDFDMTSSVVAYRGMRLGIEFRLIRGYGAIGDLRSTQERRWWDSQWRRRDESGEAMARVRGMSPYRLRACVSPPGARLMWETTLRERSGMLARLGSESSTSVIEDHGQTSSCRWSR
jgi:hypothetical protein